MNWGIKMIDTKKKHYQKQKELLAKLQQLDPMSDEFNATLKEYRAEGTKSIFQENSRPDYTKPYQEAPKKEKEAKQFENDIQNKHRRQFGDQRKPFELLLRDTKETANSVSYINPMSESASKLAYDLDQNLSELYQRSGQEYQNLINKCADTLAKFDDDARKYGIKTPKRSFFKLREDKIKQSLANPNIPSKENDRQFN